MIAKQSGVRKRTVVRLESNNQLKKTVYILRNRILSTFASDKLSKSNDEKEQ